jgi:hypothetical protein
MKFDEIDENDENYSNENSPVLKKNRVVEI